MRNLGVRDMDGLLLVNDNKHLRYARKCRQEFRKLAYHKYGGGVKCFQGLRGDKIRLLPTLMLF